MSALTYFALVSVLLTTAACASEFEGGGDLRAQKVLLQRAVDGNREIVARLESGEPLLPRDDVTISIDEALILDLVGAQLPFEQDVDRFHLVLTKADVQFRGSPTVRLSGRLNLKERPGLSAAAEVIGALEDIRVDVASSTLKATIAVDHIGITEATGISQILSGSALDEVARLVRLQIKDQLPPIQIPVKVQQTIDFPALTDGPVRIDGASMPLQVGVSQVTAGQGRLWIALHFQPGDFVKTADAPPSGDARASDAGVSLGATDEGTAKPSPAGKGKSQKEEGRKKEKEKGK